MHLGKPKSLWIRCLKRRVAALLPGGAGYQRPEKPCRAIVERKQSILAGVVDNEGPAAMLHVEHRLFVTIVVQ